MTKERTKERKGEEDDRLDRRFQSQRERNHKSRPPYDELLTYSP